MSGCEPLQIRRSDCLSFATLTLTADVDDSFKRKLHFLLFKDIRIALPAYAGRVQFVEFSSLEFLLLTCPHKLRLYIV